MTTDSIPLAHVRSLGGRAVAWPASGRRFATTREVLGTLIALWPLTGTLLLIALLLVSATKL